jgi:hypothetical protein
MGIQDIAVEGFASCDLRRVVLAVFGGHPVSPVLGSGAAAFRHHRRPVAAAVVRGRLRHIRLTGARTERWK